MKKKSDKGAKILTALIIVNLVLSLGIIGFLIQDRLMSRQTIGAQMLEKADKYTLFIGSSPALLFILIILHMMSVQHTAPGHFDVQGGTFLKIFSLNIYTYSPAVPLGTRYCLQNLSTV